VNVGFAPVGNLLGHTLAGGQYKWLLIPWTDPHPTDNRKKRPPVVE